MRSPVIRRWLVLVLILGPVLYGGALLGVLIHEVLGHGLSAIALGGEFRDFVVRLDVSGAAWTSLPPDTGTAGNVLHLASGVGVELLLALILALVARPFRRAGLPRIALLLLALLYVTEPARYVFFNMWGPYESGDAGVILTLLDTPSLRWWFLIGSAAIWLAFGTILYRAAFGAMEDRLSGGRGLSRPGRFLAAVTLIAIPGSIGAVIYDWNDLFPGIGKGPWVVDIAYAWCVAALLAVLPFRSAGPSFSEAGATPAPRPA